MVPGTCQAPARPCLNPARAWHRSRPKRTGARSLGPRARTRRARDPPAVVTFSSRGSPGTTVTRPPRASTSDAQSLAAETSPSSADRSTSAANACGVWTARSSSRGSVSTTRSPSTRLIVSATGTPGTAPSQPVAERRQHALDHVLRHERPRGVVDDERRGGLASASATPSRTDSARLAPPVTVADTLPQPSSSATRIDGSSQPSGATTTIASIQSEASSRSRLSARSGRPAERREGFGAVPAEPLAAAGRDEDRPGTQGRRR